MNFFAHQEMARAQTRHMLLLFTLAVVCIVVAVDVVLMLTIGLGRSGLGGPFDYGALLLVSLGVVAIIGSATLYRVATLRSGGSAVALGLGATPVPTDTSNFTYRRLRNVVEEIAIASGLPVPAIFVLEHEAAINAFAAGYSPSDAAITVTRGCLDKLTRDELQGVIAHEFSHVLNGDMRLNIHLMGVAFGILAISVIGRRIVAGGVGRSRGRNFGSVAFVGLGLLAVGSIGVFFARLIKASISRQREYLADASAVQFTRQTEGIARALKKIGGLDEGSKLTSSSGEEVAHMLFGDGVGYSSLFSTHPPLTDRIKRLDPGFDVSEFADIAADWEWPVRVGEAGGEEASVAGFAPARSAHVESPTSKADMPYQDAQFAITVPGVVSQVGRPDQHDYAIGATLHARIPRSLRDAARSQEDVMSLVFALVLHQNAAPSTAQLMLVERNFDSGTSALVQRLATEAAQLHPMLRLPLAALAFPALRRRPRAELQVFVLTLKQLIDADGRVTLQEYCLAKLIEVQVIDALNPAAARVMGWQPLAQMTTDVHALLATVARFGHDDANAARRAYMLGLNEVLPQEKPDYAPPVDWALALDRALSRLDRLAPPAKELLVSGLTRAISADALINVSEAELLRTICAALHCPLPALLQHSD